MTNLGRNMEGLECPVCMEAFHEDGDHCPLLLTCAHTLCRNCCIKLATGRKDCPTCRGPVAAMEALRPNFQLLEILRGLNKEVERRKNADSAIACANECEGADSEVTH